MVMMAALAGCSSQSAPTGKPKLTVGVVAYDCASRKLTVIGTAEPAREGQGVQVQVRTDQRPKAPVWRIEPTDEAGQFTARGTYAIEGSAPVELRVRLASVVGGARVFSPITSQQVTCS